MHGQEGERRSQRHMWPVHSLAKASTAALAVSLPPISPPLPETVNFDQIEQPYFLKDGRKFHVGNCALFQAGNSPPFIGIICCFSPGNTDFPQLVVNWLYRPCDLKLSKGISIEAAPNEVFYSFHQDEISAASLLHPCKVAFLCKGIDLPSGVSSFVCWRVYDTTNKCLWWLTDKDYVDERQEEVNRLLERTQREMQPKPSFTSRLNSQTKGKKSELGSELMKRDRHSKIDAGDFAIKAEIAKITENGGLVNSDAVEKFVQLMKLERGERKFDVVERALLANVITATEKNDYLKKFVQLRGIHVLDDWLQEAHKGKNGADKSPEELLLALLRALDKLPVNLNALQACNIGKSVNHLRGHKNSEIQKKAKGLFDTWKKRVDAEMRKIEMAKLNDSKSTVSGEEVHSKNQLSRCQMLPSKSSSLTNGSKDSQKKAEPNSTKEEKSCSSGQSHSNSQSCSKEDIRSSANGSKTGVTSRRQRSRILNPQQSPSYSASGGSLEENQSESPVLSEKNEFVDQKSKSKTDSSEVKAEISWQSNKVKAAAGTDQSDRTPTSLLNEEHDKNTDEAVKLVESENGAGQVSREAHDIALTFNEKTAKSNSGSPENKVDVKSEVSVSDSPVNTENIDSKKDEFTEVKPSLVNAPDLSVSTSPTIAATDKSSPKGIDFDQKIDATSNKQADESENEKSTDMEMISRRPELKPEEDLLNLVAVEQQLSPRLPKAQVHEPEETADSMLGFDLNEGFSVEEELVNPPKLPLFPNLPLHITIAAPAKGPFVPPENLLRVKGEGGWKGSAATSAFRPAEPRKALEPSDADLTAVAKQSRPRLDIDLNVVDEMPQEEEEDLVSRKKRSNVDFDLNLNRVDRVVDLSSRSTPASFKDFDLNNGPGVEDGVREWLPRGQHGKGSGVIFLPSMQNANQVNVLGSQATWSSAIGGDFYRGPVISSSSGMPFYGFGSYVDSASGQPFVKPYLINLPAGGGSDVSQWGWHGFDLNSGPAGMEIDAANRSALTSSQVQVNAGSAVKKRKEPEGGWDPDALTFRHPPCQ